MLHGAAKVVVGGGCWRAMRVAGGVLVSGTAGGLSTGCCEP